MPDRLHNAREEMKSLTIELNLKYNNEQKQSIKISEDMKYVTFIQKIVQSLNIKKLSDTKRIEDMVQITFTSNSGVFNKKTYFNIQNTIPQITHVTIDTDGKAILNFIPEYRGSFEVEAQLGFESGDIQETYMTFAKLPIVFPLKEVDTVAEVLQTYPSSITCKFRMRSTTIPGLEFGEWSKVCSYGNRLTDDNLAPW
ncbi:hypothetical protein RFI_11312 [Reticulomyxa filosa]|uniref:Uncharacterized protein n=1 Tax=Reticulomyxa filosa TaxID=46433 RepID=X6NIM2_RETFI|nr:hypothetical protein RFI_11312 [Reticulomyxa filosa]|eukprot:ETO25826.1 hypothetical protein RFI_11312 [Reticulomyxa filosa]